MHSALERHFVGSLVSQTQNQDQIDAKLTAANKTNSTTADKISCGSTSSVSGRCLL